MLGVEEAGVKGESPTLRLDGDKDVVDRYLRDLLLPLFDVAGVAAVAAAATAVVDVDGVFCFRLLDGNVNDRTR